MTNYESTSYHVEDSKGRSLAFSTVDRPGEEHVLRAWSTQELADGQLTELEVNFGGDDVRGLQSFLNDRYGRAKSGGKSAATQSDEDNAAYFKSGRVSALKEVLATEGNWDARQAIQWAREQLSHLDENLPAVEDIYLPAEPDYTPGPEVYGAQTSVLVDAANAAGYDVPQVHRCPHISNGVQCNFAEHTTEYGHSYDYPYAETAPDGYQTVSQTSDGVVTPPADVPATTLAATGGEQADASANGAATAEAAPSDAKPKRKRRTKLEIAYDAALEAYTKDTNESTYNTLAEAHNQLSAKDPGNSRVSGQGQGPAPSTPDEIRQELSAGVLPAPAQPEVRFADEPVNPFLQPMPETPAQAGARYLEQAQHPMNQQFAEWANNLPGEHIQDSVVMTSEEAQAATGFPCPQRAADGRQCVRPCGHELQTATNPEPKPHIYATDPGTLPNVGYDPSLHAAEEQFEQQHPSVPAQPAFTVSTPQPAGFTPGGGAQILSFQTPPTPAQPIAPQGANLQPQAPAAPFLQPVPPNGGQ